MTSKNKRTKMQIYSISDLTRSFFNQLTYPVFSPPLFPILSTFSTYFSSVLQTFHDCSHRYLNHWLQSLMSTDSYVHQLVKVRAFYVTLKKEADRSYLQSLLDLTSTIGKQRAFSLDIRPIPTIGTVIGNSCV